jgi:hypothetical protein
MSAPHGAGGHPTAMDFDRAELGLLPEDRRRDLAAHVLQCGRCAETQQTLQRTAAHFRGEISARTLPRALAAAGGRAARLRRWWSTVGAGLRWALLATPVAAGLVLAVGTSGLQGRRTGPATAVVDEEPAISTKGPPALRLFVRRGERVFAPRSGEALEAGDAVRFVVEPRGRRYLLVVSIDGAGQVSVYHPFQGARSAPLQAAPRVELPGSIVLDRAPGPERVFAVFSDEALSTAAVREPLERMAAGGPERIRREGALPLAGTEQASFLFEKAESPR